MFKEFSPVTSAHHRLAIAGWKARAVGLHLAPVSPEGVFDEYGIRKDVLARRPADPAQYVAWMSDAKATAAKQILTSKEAGGEECVFQTADTVRVVLINGRWVTLEKPGTPERALEQLALLTHNDTTVYDCAATTYFGRNGFRPTTDVTIIETQLHAFPHADAKRLVDHTGYVLEVAGSLPITDIGWELLTSTRGSMEICTTHLLPDGSMTPVTLVDRIKPDPFLLYKVIFSGGKPAVEALEQYTAQGMKQK